MVVTEDQATAIRCEDYCSTECGPQFNIDYSVKESYESYLYDCMQDKCDICGPKN